MSRPSLILLPVLALLVAAVAAGWAWPDHPGTPAPPDRFPSLSYAPFHPGESPLAQRFPAPAEVDADLALLAPHTGAIRTYAAAEGAYDIAALAQAHGLKLWQGIWLGADRARNAQEIARGIAIAHRYPHTVDRLVVGSEVLLRGDLPPSELMAALDQVRAAVRQPVTYADVWTFWEAFPELARHVDLITLHLLPYWEDVPIAAADAVAHVAATHRRIAARFPGQPVAVGEAGWPSRGRQRAGAAPGRVEQAAFVAGVTAWAAQAHVDLNLVEAFDQDWKSRDEGVAGANWGLWTADRQAKYPAGTEVRNDPHRPIHATASVLLGVLLLAAALAQPGVPPARQVRLAVAAMLLGTALAFANAEILPVLYDPAARLAGGVDLLGQMLLAALTMRRLARPRRPQSGSLDDSLGALFTLAATGLQVLLVLDSRYRSFPLPAFAVPVAATLLRAAIRDLPRAGWPLRCAGLVLAAGGLASAWLEGGLNQQSLVWNACALVLAGPPLLRLLSWHR